MTTISTISFAPLLPWPLLLALSLASLALLALAGYRRAPGTWWRALALGTGLLALANPALVEEQRDPLDDVALVVVDNSASQNVGERQARAEAALAQIQGRLQDAETLELRTIRAGGRAPDDTSVPDGTRLIDAMKRALSDVPRERVAGVMLLTDGQVHDLPDDLKRADPGAPVHVLLTGERGERDRRLVVERAPRYGIVGETLSLDVRIEDQGVDRSEPVRVTVTQDGVEAVDHFLPIGETQSIPVKLSHGGPTVLEIDVEAGDGELTLINNRAVMAVTGVRDRLRVLLVSGEPHAGERTWRNLLKSDPSVDLVHFTILRPPEKQDGTPIDELSLISFPTRELFEAKLEEFDLIIFDRYRRRGVLPDLYLRNVVDYVRSGGAVLTAAGPAFATPLSLYRTPLADVLPARPTGEVLTQGFKPRLTVLGRRHPVTAELPGANDGDPTWGRWFRMIDVERGNGTVLMEGVDDKPVLILGRTGEGRVAQLLSDHAWLWARGFEGGGPQSELLRRVAHWLMKEPDLEEEDLRATTEGDRLRITRQSLSAEPVTVSVTSPSGKVHKVPLTDGGHGTATGMLTVDEPGMYHVTDGTRTAVAAVGDINPKEFADLRTTADVLAPLTELTGGGVHWLSDGMPDIRRVKPERQASGRDWIGIRENGDYLVTGVEQLPLLPALLTLALLLGLFMYAWYREGR